MFLQQKPKRVIDFQFIPDTIITAEVWLKNVTTNFVAFKVKTNAPKAYIVCPSQGLIMPNDEIYLSISMQALEELPQSVNHRFQIKAASTAEQIALADIKKYLDSASSVQSINLTVNIRSEYSETEFDQKEAELKDSILQERNKNDAKVRESLTLAENLQKLTEKIDKSEDLQNFKNVQAYRGFSIVNIAIAFLIGMIIGYLSNY